MTRRAMVPLAYFGKLKSRGDFVRSASQPTLIHTLDDWLSQGIERMSGDPRWKEVYDRGPGAHFAFFSGSNPRGIAGHLTASADASGRRFPFVVAGTFEVAEPLVFLPFAPMALARLWARFEQAARLACAAEDAATTLAEIAQVEIELDVEASAYEATQRDFVELQTIASLETMLRQGGHEIDLRQALLAIGLLLQPVLGTTGVSLKKGLCLPLPADPLYRPLVASFWLELVVPFLRRLDLEIALFLPRQGATPGSLTGDRLQRRLGGASARGARPRRCGSGLHRPFAGGMGGGSGAAGLRRDQAFELSRAARALVAPGDGDLSRNVPRGVTGMRSSHATSCVPVAALVAGPGCVRRHGACRPARLFGERQPVAPASAAVQCGGLVTRARPGDRLRYRARRSHAPGRACSCA